MHRRLFLTAAACLPALPALAAAPRIVVYKTATCGCCAAWVDHLIAAGFVPEVHDMAQDALWALKEAHGIAPPLWSCHTADVEGYLVEGHVPAADITRLLAERPEALGLAVPGMPSGAPGMEMGARVEPYLTLLFAAEGRVSVFARHG